MSDKPPFRADHVGSLLRPAEVRRARAELDSGLGSRHELAYEEDAAVDRLVRRQEEIGLDSVTDGEIRRRTWLDFLGELEGTTPIQVEVRPQGGPPSTMTVPKVTGKIAFSGHSMLAHFEYLARRTTRTPKMTIPAPSMLVSAMRDWRQIVSREAYPDIAEFYLDLGLAYRDAVQAFYAAGCRYLQFDDVNLAYLCDASSRARIEARGDDPDALLGIWVDTINAAIAGRPDDMTLTTHLCRGNFRSTWFAEGGYDAVADALFNRCDYDGYFLEYDSARAGSFEPLRLLPANKHVVLGLITTKVGRLESKGDVVARIEAAATRAPLERLCLSPQCGFASTEEGNLLEEDEQWAKLHAVVEIASEVWPDA